MFTVGQRVRVLDKSKDESQRGVISYIDEDSQLYDIIWDLNSKEDCGIPIDRIASLESFELNGKERDIFQWESQSWKDYGNKLFTLKDYYNAARYYQNGIQRIDHVMKERGLKALDIGTHVITFSEAIGDYLWGMVASIENDEEVEIILSNDEERVMKLSKLQILPESIEEQILYRTLYLNLAKCQLKRQQKGWAIRSSSMALALTLCLQATSQDATASSKTLSTTDIKKYFTDGYYFRGKALLLANRPGRATLDCRALASYDTAKSKSLENEIMQQKKKQQKENRKLAKDIAAWVDRAMTDKSSNNQPAGISSSSANADVEDIDIEVMDDDYDEEEKRSNVSHSRGNDHAATSNSIRESGLIVDSKLSTSADFQTVYIILAIVVAMLFAIFFFVTKSP